MLSPLSTAAAAARRHLALILTVLLAVSTFSIVTAGPARADAGTTTQLDGITYTFDPGNPAAGATVTGYDSSAGTAVSIPRIVSVDSTEYAVTAIGASVFEDVKLNSVTFPDTLTAVGDWAFYDSDLASVALPESLTSIGSFAFTSNELTEVSVPDAVTTIGNSTFAHNQLTSVTLSNQLTSLGHSAFENNQLSKVTLPDTLTTISSFAFAINKLESVSLPGNLTTIGTQAFIDNQLTSVALPDTLTSIGNAAFIYNQLTSVTLPDGLTTLGTQVFADNKLTSVTLPDTLTSIGYDVFATNQLTSVALPADLTNIGETAFAGNQLTSIVIPAGVTSIGDDAFQSNPELTQVRFTGQAPTTITGADRDWPSLGAATGLTVEFPARYLAPDEQQGYTSPVWRGYHSTPAFTVSFDSRGGSAVAPATAWPSATLTLPTAPVREGYTFTGWYTTSQAETRFDPALPLTSDVSVYAGWEAATAPSTPSTPGWSSLELGSSLDTALGIDLGSLGGLIPVGYSD